MILIILADRNKLDGYSSGHILPAQLFSEFK